MTRFFDKRKIIVAVILSFLFTVMQVVGYQISGMYHTSVHQSSFFQNIAVLTKMQCLMLAIIEFILWSLIILLLFTLLERIKSPEINHEGRIGLRIWLFTGLLLFICWMPCFLAGYPSFYDYDGFQQVPQALYPQVQYSAHHPLLHTLLMGKIIAFGYHHGVELNDGLVLYSIFQMLFCAVVFSYVLCFIRRITGRRWLFILAFCYYAFCPVIPMFAISTTKDVIFSALLLLTVMFLYEMCGDMTAFFASKKKIIRFFVISLLMCLFRKNGIYIVLCAIPFILLLYKKYWRRLIVLFGTVILLSIVVNRGLIWVLHAENASMKEMLSVPMQQIARVYNDYGEDAFDEKELELIYKGIAGELICQYDPLLSDPIKNFFDFDVFLDNKMEFLKLWLHKGLQYPKAYLKAFLENTYQAWYPGTSIYDRPFAEQTVYFELGMWSGGYRDSKLPLLLPFYEKIATDYYYQKIPGVRLLFSIGAMLWVSLFVMSYAIYRKNRPLMAAILMVHCCCVTVLLGPVSLVRYYLILFYGFPVYIGFLFTPKTDFLDIPKNLLTTVGKSYKI